MQIPRFHRSNIFLQRIANPLGRLTEDRRLTESVRNPWSKNALLTQRNPMKKYPGEEWVARVFRHYAKAFSIQEIPSRRSISVMVLNEKLVFPDKILLTYCGVHPNRSAISALDKLFSCMKSTIFSAMLCDHLIQALFSCLHLASSTNEEASWLSCASKNLNVFSFIFLCSIVYNAKI